MFGTRCPTAQMSAKLMAEFHDFSVLCSCDSVRVVISIVFGATPASGVVHVTASQLQLKQIKP
jgi:hypothetical protein